MEGPGGLPHGVRQSCSTALWMVQLSAQVSKRCPPHSWIPMDTRSNCLRRRDTQSITALREPVGTLNTQRRSRHLLRSRGAQASLPRWPAIAAIPAGAYLDHSTPPSTRHTAANDMATMQGPHTCIQPRRSFPIDRWMTVSNRRCPCIGAFVIAPDRLLPRPSPARRWRLRPGLRLPPRKRHESAQSNHRDSRDTSHEALTRSP